MIDEGLGNIRVRGCDEARPPPRRGVRVKRELWHDENGATYVVDREIHAARSVVECAEVNDSIGQAVSLRLLVTAPDTQKHQPPGIDGPDDLSIHGDVGAKNALQKRAHAVRPLGR